MRNTIYFIRICLTVFVICFVLIAIKLLLVLAAVALTIGIGIGYNLYHWAHTRLASHRHQE